MKKNPGLGENLEDRHGLEYQRSASQPLLKNPVLLVNLEDFHNLPADPEELEWQRAVRPVPLLPSTPRLSQR